MTKIEISILILKVKELGQEVWRNWGEIPPPQKKKNQNY